MELGQRLRQARLEAGLSQRQLCGEVITRNMLSQIENGSARPSMETLRYLASRLGKPISFFLEEQAITSPNQSCIAQARQAFAAGEYRQTLEQLKMWQGEEDPVFDAERRLLEALSCLRQADIVLNEGKNNYAIKLLEQASEAGGQTPYYTQEMERSRILLAYRAQPAAARQLSACLPTDMEELFLRAQAALEEGKFAQSGRLLDAAAACETPRWHFLRAEVYFQQKDYRNALFHYQKAETAAPRQVVERLEVCCRELEDYKMAYQYACKLRQM